MAWIKFDKDLINDPRILRAAEILCGEYTIGVERTRGVGFSSGRDLDPKEHLAMMRNAVTGAVVTLWVYADTHIRDGDMLPISVTAVDSMVGIDGFCALMGDEWIKEQEGGESVVLPGYCEKNGLLAKDKRKTSNAERQRRFREKRNAISNAVTNAVSNANVTPLDQDLDQDLDLKKKSNVGLAPDPRQQAKEILSFLNEKTGRSYEPLPANLEPIIARLKEGSSPLDIRQVVAKKCREWIGDDKMNIYLRPKTLFNRANFANYKGELVNVPSE